MSKAMLIPRGGRGAQHIFRGRAIGKGIDFPDIGIKNGINFHNFSVRNGTDFQDLGMKCSVGYAFSKNWYKERILLFQKIGIRNGYVFEASMVRLRPKSGQVHPPGLIQGAKLKTEPS